MHTETPNPDSSTGKLKTAIPDKAVVTPHPLDLHPHDHSDEAHLQENRFHFGPFYFWTSLQLAAALGIFYWIAPDTFRQEFSQPGMILMWTFLFGLPMSLFEYLYHRYLLHSAVLPFLGVMHKCHAHHHGLTNVKAAISGKEPDKMVEVDSEYPIVHEHQEESMQFPYFSAAVFYGIFLILLGPFKFLFPSQPIIVSVLFTVTLAYAAYELWHAVLHLPFERYWLPGMKSERWGNLIKYVYGFHLMHHWRPITNQAVVGFWGVALWDHLFRTHHRPGRMPLDGAMVNHHDAEIPKPRWPINSLDRLQGRLYKGSRKIERTLAKIFLGKRVDA